jgi:hypothetical protein
MYADAHMAKAPVIPFPCESVTQAEIEVVVLLDSQVRNLLKVRDRLCSDVLRKLIDGRPVDPGAHSADLECMTRGTAVSYRLAIDGRVMR